MYCGTLETITLDSKLIMESEFGTKFYKIDLVKYQDLLSNLINLLTPYERDRANRYHFSKDKNRFIICRSLLKVLLAEHLGLQVEKICIDIDANKKPYLASHPSVYFNVTHAGDYALIAIAKTPVGIDIEYINKSFDFTEILSSVFSDTEINHINNSNNKRNSFYQLWTRKEAVVKAIGKGIDENLIKITVTDGSHSIFSSEIGNFKNMNIFSFNLNDDYIGAFAISENLNNFEKIIFSPIPTSDKLRSIVY